MFGLLAHNTLLNKVLHILHILFDALPSEVLFDSAIGSSYARMASQSTGLACSYEFGLKS
jgi:hypothetical protein